MIASQGEHLAVDVGTGLVDTLVAVEPHRSIFDPAWSSDGEWLAFTSSRLGNLNIWIAPVVGGESEPVTLGPGDQVTPVWSPDGEIIYFASRPSGNWDVWSTSVWGDPPLQVTADPSADFPASVTPNGEDLVFFSTRPASTVDTVAGFWSMPVDGGTPHRLFPVLFPRNGSGGPSADASRAVAANRSTGEIWVRDPVDSEPRLLVKDNARHPRFSPDGEQVSYLRLIEAGIHDIYIADVRRIVSGSVIP